MSAVEDAAPAGPVFRRVVLKMSGDSFTRPGEPGISLDEGTKIARQAERGGVGGGKILRGSQFRAANPVVTEATAHYMGMLATVINGLALQDALESLGCQTRLQTAIRMEGVAEPFIRRRCVRPLGYGRTPPRH